MRRVAKDAAPSRRTLRQFGGFFASLSGGKFRELRSERSVVGVRAWIDGVEVERTAADQVLRLSAMKGIIKYPIAVMPDVHYGHGITVGIVVPTIKAIIPATVGVDIGCGMIATRTSLAAKDLPADLRALRLDIELAVPHGRTHNGSPTDDAGSWRQLIPPRSRRLLEDQTGTHVQEDMCLPTRDREV